MFEAQDAPDDLDRDLLGLCIRLAYEEAYNDGVRGGEPCAVNRWWCDFVEAPAHDRIRRAPR